MQSSIDGCLGFYFLAFMNISTSICVDMISFLMAIYPGVGHAGSCGNYISLFEELPTVSKVAAQFYIPTSSEWGSNFSTVSQSN